MAPATTVGLVLAVICFAGCVFPALGIDASFRSGVRGSGQRGASYIAAQAAPAATAAKVAPAAIAAPTGPTGAESPALPPLHFSCAMASENFRGERKCVSQGLRQVFVRGGVKYCCADATKLNEYGSEVSESMQGPGQGPAAATGSAGTNISPTPALIGGATGATGAAQKPVPVGVWVLKGEKGALTGIHAPKRTTLQALNDAIEDEDQAHVALGAAVDAEDRPAMELARDRIGLAEVRKTQLMEKVMAGNQNALAPPPTEKPTGGTVSSKAVSFSDPVSAKTKRKTRSPNATATGVTVVTIGLEGSSDLIDYVSVTAVV